MNKLNLYVVDDDEAVRRSLGLLFLSRGYAVQTFESGETFLASIRPQDGGCVILDLRMVGMSGLQVFDELRLRSSPLVVLFLSGNGDISTAVDAVQRGAFGWLEKPCSEDILLEKVKLALTRAAEVVAIADAQHTAQTLWDKLTEREQEVARCVANGDSNKEIARTLLPPCEPRTVETHRAKAYAKLGLSNPTELDRFIRDHAL
jgi:two-component system, LuxR family, response regulator TtrR